MTSAQSLMQNELNRHLVLLNDIIEKDKGAFIPVPEPCALDLCPNIDIGDGCETIDICLIVDI